MGDSSDQKIYIDLIHYPLYSLGPDTRVGIWFQGCDIGCPECISTHTWKQTDEKSMSVKCLVDQLKDAGIKRLTISGGEPFMQPEVLFEILKEIRNDFDDILVYSGYEYRYLNQSFPKILDLIDVLIDSPFIKSLPTNKIYKGSENQNIYLFNDDLLDLYSEYMIQTKHTVQIHQTERETYVLGIPKSTDARYIKEILQGVE